MLFRERVEVLKNTDDSRFLPHLKNCVPESAHNYMLSSYTIILEAWRRGLDVTIRYNKQKSGSLVPTYFISDKNKTHRFSITRGDLVSAEAKDITKNKHTAKEYLIKAGVATPKGESFDEYDSDDDILDYSRKASYPLVLKPIDGTGGTGVIANIKNDEEMVHALKYVRNELNSKNVIVEKYFEGEDHRFYVVGDEVIGVFKRDPASVKGNGKDTIQNLLKKKNEERSKIPSVKNMPIKVDSETKELLRRLGYTMQSVPNDGEFIFLKSKSNVSSGGEAVDVTDETSDELKQIAIDATKSIPTLVQAGVDMMIDKDNNTGVVIEINTRAHIRTHLFPSYGKARDIPSAIIDYYFPETRNYSRKESSKFYIDYDFIHKSILSRDVGSIMLPKFPKSPITLKRYIVSGVNYSESFAHRIRKFAFNYHLNGYIKPLKNSNIAIIVGGNKNQVELFYTRLKKYSTQLFKNATITEKNRNTAIAHGFKIVESETSQKTNDNPSNIYLERYSNLKNDYQKLIRKLSEYEQKESVMELTKRQNEQLKKKIKHVEGSTSWKVTKPLRVLGKFKK